TMRTWLLRFLGFLFMAIGIFLVFNPLAVLADIVPFLGGLTGFFLAIFAAITAFTLSFITIGIAWIFYRPMIGIPLLIVGGLGLIAIFVMAGKSKRRAVPREIK